MLGQRYASHPLLYPNVIQERAYQTKIARESYSKNTLVILPTALGKTVISALVVSQLLYDYRNARVLVIAPTRPLVMQHRSSFQRMLRLPEGQFALLTGKSPADYRSSVWAGSSRLIFATLEYHTALDDLAYNFSKEHSSLRVRLARAIPTRGKKGTPKRWMQRTPAMASGITDHKWSMMELTTYPIISSYRRGT